MRIKNNFIFLYLVDNIGIFLVLLGNFRRKIMSYSIYCNSTLNVTNFI